MRFSYCRHLIDQPMIKIQPPTGDQPQLDDQPLTGAQVFPTGFPQNERKAHKILEGEKFGEFSKAKEWN